MVTRLIIADKVGSIEMEDMFPDGKFTIKDLEDFVYDMRIEDEKSEKDFRYKFSYYGHDGGCEIIKYEIREENDKEYAARIKKASKWRGRYVSYGKFGRLL